MSYLAVRLFLVTLGRSSPTPSPGDDFFVIELELEKFPSIHLVYQRLVATTKLIHKDSYFKYYL